MTQRKPDPIQRCQSCGKVMTRKRYGGQLESITAFQKRKYCDRLCHARATISPAQEPDKPTWAALPDPEPKPVPAPEPEPANNGAFDPVAVVGKSIKVKMDGKMSYKTKRQLGLL